MALNHVSKWTKHGWRRITSTEAAREHLNITVPAKSGLFMCELCGQYVTFTINNHFRHSLGEVDKDCEERSKNMGTVASFHPREYDLPMKIVVKNNDFHLELGFPPLPHSIISAYLDKQIVITGSGYQPVKYSLERIGKDCINYLKINGISSTGYQLQMPLNLQEYLPQRVRGINEKGTLFLCDENSEAGKRLSETSDVICGKKYFLLTTDKLPDSNYQLQGVGKRLLCLKTDISKTWYLYLVNALRVDKSAANFFWNHGNYRLTDQPLRIIPLWPLYAQTPYIMKHHQDYIIIHLTGMQNVTAKMISYPNMGQPMLIHDINNSKLIKLPSTGRQMLIAIGYTNVQHYWYFWQEALVSPKIEINITVTDCNNNFLPDREQSTLPPKGIVRIIAPYNGSVIKRNGETKLEKIPLESDTLLSVTDVTYGMTLQILQGLDIVWQATYIKSIRKNTPISNTNIDDKSLYQKLSGFDGQEIPVPHSFGAVAAQLTNYPQTVKWLYAALRRGYAPKKAVKYLKATLVKKDVQGDEYNL